MGFYTIPTPKSSDFNPSQSIPQYKTRKAFLDKQWPLTGAKKLINMNSAILYNHLKEALIKQTGNWEEHVDSTHYLRYISLP